MKSSGVTMTRVKIDSVAGEAVFAFCVVVVVVVDML